MEQEEHPIILDVNRISLSFGENKVFSDLSFQVLRGSSLAIIGPNGAGKTMLLKALIGAVPFKGAVTWAQGVRIGYVPQKLDLDRDLPMTGNDFLKARASLIGNGMNIGSTLDLVGISSGIAGQLIGTMSGGQFQRLLVAFALIGNPDVLLLDEPTAGVDEPGQEHLNEVIHRLQKDKKLTILFISHELSVVFKYATSVLCLSRIQPCLGIPRAILTPEKLQEIYGTMTEYHVHG